MDMLMRELRDYGKALRPEDRKVLDEVLRSPLKHYGSISYASSIHAWAFLLLSIIVQQQKQIRRLEHARMAHRHVPNEEADRPLVENA